MRKSSHRPEQVGHGRRCAKQPWRARRREFGIERLAGVLRLGVRRLHRLRREQPAAALQFLTALRRVGGRQCGVVGEALQVLVEPRHLHARNVGAVIPAARDGAPILSGRPAVEHLVVGQVVDDREFLVDRIGESGGVEASGVGEKRVDIDADALRIHDHVVGVPIDQRRNDRGVAAACRHRGAAGMRVHQHRSEAFAADHPQADIAWEVGLASRHVHDVRDVRDVVIRQHPRALFANRSSLPRGTA